MPVKISAKFNDTDLNKVLKKYTQLQGDAQDMRRPMESIGQAIKTRIQLGFRFSKDPYGTPWKALKPYWKYQNGIKTRRAGRPLRDTSRLVNSMTYRAGKTRVTVGTNVVYARTQQEGINGVTPRPFMPTSAKGMPEKWKTAIINQVKKHLND